MICLIWFILFLYDPHFFIKDMKKIQWLFVAVITFSSVVFAQDKLLTLDDIFNPDAAKRVRFGGAPVFVQWAPDGKSFKQMVNGKLMRVDAATGQAVPYYDSGSLVNALMRVGLKVDEANGLANSPGLRFNADESGILLNNASAHDHKALLRKPNRDNRYRSPCRLRDHHA